MFIETEDGRPLQLSGKTTLSVDTNALGIEETDDGQPDSYAWSFVAETAKWKQIAALKYAAGGGRKKRATVRMAQVTVIIPFPLPYINLDKPVWKRIRCTVIIQVYADIQFTRPLSDVSLQVITMTPSDVVITYARGYVNRDGRACVTILCGYKHIIVLKPLLGEVIPHPTHHLPTGLTYENVGGKVIFT